MQSRVCEQVHQVKGKGKCVSNVLILPRNYWLSILTAPACEALPGSEKPLIR